MKSETQETTTIALTTTPPVLPVPKRAQHPTPVANMFTPRTREEVIGTCQVIAQSNICPKGLKNDWMAVYACWETGERFGMSMLASMQNIAIINGKISMYGDMLIGVCWSFPECENIEETYTGSIEDGTYTATCTVKRRGKDEPIVRTWTIPQAKKARLWNKPGPWTDYPDRMLQMRARSWALRDAFPDRLLGVTAREEAEDYEIIDAQTRQRTRRPDGPVVDADPAPQQIEAPGKMTKEIADYFLEMISTADDLHVLGKVKAEFARYEHCDLKESLRQPWIDRNKLLHSLAAEREAAQKEEKDRPLDPVSDEEMRELGYEDDATQAEQDSEGEAAS